MVTRIFFQDGDRRGFQQLYESLQFTANNVASFGKYGKLNHIEQEHLLSDCPLPNIGNEAPEEGVEATTRAIVPTTYANMNSFLRKIGLSEKERSRLPLEGKSAYVQAANLGRMLADGNISETQFEDLMHDLNEEHALELNGRTAGGALRREVGSTMKWGTVAGLAGAIATFRGLSNKNASTGWKMVAFVPKLAIATGAGVLSFIAGGTLGASTGEKVTEFIGENMGNNMFTRFVGWCLGSKHTLDEKPSDKTMARLQEAAKLGIQAAQEAGTAVVSLEDTALGKARNQARSTTDSNNRTTTTNNTNSQATNQATTNQNTNTNTAETQNDNPINRAPEFPQPKTSDMSPEDALRFEIALLKNYRDQEAMQGHLPAVDAALKQASQAYAQFGDPNTIPRMEGDQFKKLNVADINQLTVKYPSMRAPIDNSEMLTSYGKQQLNMYRAQLQVDRLQNDNLIDNNRSTQSKLEEVGIETDSLKRNELIKAMVEQANIAMIEGDTPKGNKAWELVGRCLSRLEPDAKNLDDIAKGKLIEKYVAEINNKTPELVVNNVEQENTNHKAPETGYVFDRESFEERTLLVDALSRTRNALDVLERQFAEYSAQQPGKASLNEAIGIVSNHLGLAAEEVKAFGKEKVLELTAQCKKDLERARNNLAEVQPSAKFVVEDVVGSEPTKESATAKDKNKQVVKA